eukprot:8245912-Alexandrium_andersonii.AAC.1
MRQPRSQATAKQRATDRKSSAWRSRRTNQGRCSGVQLGQQPASSMQLWPLPTAASGKQCPRPGNRGL